MQLTSPRPVATTTGTLLASQTIDTRVKNHPHNGVTMWSTDREYRLAGARDGIDTFTSVADAVQAASMLSAGEKPGLAVVTWRGGYRLHDVHTASRSYVSSAAHDWMPDVPQPATRLYKRSSVPFAAGNVRPATQDGRHTPAVVRAAEFVALVDGARAFVPEASTTWAGKSVLVESKVPFGA